MSDNNVLNNKYFQEYMIVSTKEWNRIQAKENEKEKQEGGGWRFRRRSGTCKPLGTFCTDLQSSTTASD